MQFVWWLTGVCATVAACRFVILVFKRLTSKESLNSMLDRANYGLHNAANKVAYGLEQSKKNRKKKIAKKKKEQIERNRPIVEIH